MNIDGIAWTEKMTTILQENLEEKTIRALFTDDGRKVYSTTGIVDNYQRIRNPPTIAEEIVMRLAARLAPNIHLARDELELYVKEFFLAPTFPKGKLKELVNIWQVAIPYAEYSIPPGQRIIVYSNKPKHNGEILVAKGIQLLSPEGILAFESVHDRDVCFKTVKMGDYPKEYCM